MNTIHGTILSLSAERGNGNAYALQMEQGQYREITFSAFRAQCLQISFYLREKGVRSGDRVVIISENGPEWLMAALAIMNLGAVLVPLASIATKQEFENTILDSKPQFCFLSQRLGHFGAFSSLLQSQNISFTPWDLQSLAPLDHLLQNTSQDKLDETMGPQAIALLIYTSGTTGNPKAVPITHKNVLFDAEAVLKVIQALPSDRLVSVLPLSHLFEFTGGFVVPSLLGCHITYVKSLKAEDLLSALKDSCATILIGVPLLFEIIARNLKTKLEGLPFPLPKIFAYFSRLVSRYPFLGPLLFFPVHQKLGGNIRFFMSGGSRLQPRVFEFFRGIGITILQGYGLTETSPVLTVTSLGNAAPDHVGSPIPGLSLSIFDEGGNELPIGSEGEIRVRGPNVFSGYLNPEHSSAAFTNGWFCTGDLGVLDEKKNLRITGRKKDLIVSAAGKNIYPEELESLILSSSSFLEACVLGVEDEGGHEEVNLVVVPNREKFQGLGFDQIRSAAAKQAEEACRRLADYKWPKRIEVVFEELPKTSTRKIKKHEVKKMLLLRKKEVSADFGSLNENGLDLSKDLESAVAEGIFSIKGIKPETLRLQDSISRDLGFDSLTFVELIGYLEKKFQVTVDGVEFSSLQTIKDLLSALEFLSNGYSPVGKKREVRFSNLSFEKNNVFMFRFLRRIWNVSLRSYLKVRHEMRVEGLEYLSQGGPFVFTPNHSSHFDLLSVMGALPGSMVHSTFAVAAKDYFFSSGWRALLSRILVNAIPFDRRARVKDSIQECKNVLASGGSLIIFPEGTRSVDGQLSDFKPGVGQILAGHGEVKAVPVFISGAFEIMPKGSRFPKKGPLRIRFGKPISFEHMGLETKDLRALADQLKKEVQILSGRE